MRTFSALALALVLAAPAWGEEAPETLLVELRHHAETFDSPYLTAGLRAGSHEWHQTWRFDDPMPSGQSFEADEQFVAGVGTCLLNRNCQLTSTSGDSTWAVTFNWRQLWEPEPLGPIFGPNDFDRTTFVPAMETIEGWQLTRITRTVHEARIILPGVIDRYYHGFLSQTMRIYGVSTVPEPGAAVFLLSGLLVHGLTARPPRRCPTRCRRWC